MRAGDLSKLEISKTFYTHFTRVASFDFGEIQTWKTIFWRSGHLYVYTIQSLRTVYFSVLSNNLSNWHHEQFFSRHIIQKEFNLLQTEKVHSWLHPSLLLLLWAFYCASVLTHAVDLWQVQPVHKFTNTFWPWRNSLKLHVFFDSGRRLSSLNFSSTVYCLPTSFCEFWHV